MAKKTVSHIAVQGKRVLMRVDFNVPLDDAGAITDDRRIRMAIPSIQQVLNQGGRLVLMSHLGRPAGKRVPEESLKVCATRLGELLNRPVAFAEDCVGPAAERAVADLQDGDVVLLENVRFHAAEELIDKAKKNPDGKLTAEQQAELAAFSDQLAGLGDAYVNDAFGTCHRKHASMYGVPQKIIAKGGPAVVGFLVEKELKFLGDAIANPKRPFISILGGAKVSDKIKVIEALLPKCDRVLIGGAMAYTFFLAMGKQTGKSLVEKDKVELAKSLLEKAAGKILLPVDTVVSSKIDGSAPTQIVEGDIPADLEGFDVGPKTVALYSAEIMKAGTVVWNGPMGVFETPAFAGGTNAVATAVAEATEQGGAVTVIGGGDSAAAIEQAGLADKVTHVSTGGGASLEFLEGKPFATIDILNDA